MVSSGMFLAYCGIAHSTEKNDFSTYILRLDAKDLVTLVMQAHDHEAAAAAVEAFLQSDASMQAYMALTAVTLTIDKLLMIPMHRPDVTIAAHSPLLLTIVNDLDDPSADLVLALCNVVHQPVRALHGDEHCCSTVV